MKLPSHLDLTPRVLEDIDDCLAFIARQPWGKPADRWQDILRGIGEIQIIPKRHRVLARRPHTGIELRRHAVAQFAIVYSYLEPNDEFPGGVVSIRAARHRRVKDVFMGVRQPDVPYHPADYGWSEPF